jgi:hypothetical protein
MLLVSSTQEPKQLRKTIIMLLKSGTATEIKKINYISSFQLVDKKIIKTQEKLLAITVEESKKQKLLSLIK